MQKHHSTQQREDCAFLGLAKPNTVGGAMQLQLLLTASAFVLCVMEGTVCLTSVMGLADHWGTVFG